MDAAAKQLMMAKAPDRHQLLKQAQEEAAAMKLAPRQKDYLDYYLKTMKRVVEKGEDYVFRVRVGGGERVWQGGQPGCGEGNPGKASGKGMQGKASAAGR